MPTPTATSIDATTQRELHLFALYRTFEAALLALMVFSPLGALVVELEAPAAARATTVAYLLASIVLLWQAYRPIPAQVQALIGIAVDITVAGIATFAIPEGAPGIALMLVFNVGAAALLTGLRLGIVIAAAASLALSAEFIASMIASRASVRPLAEVLMFATSFFGIATLTNFLGRQTRQSQEIAVQRTAEAANLAEVNELIIRRMRTGVLMVDGEGRVRMANEASLLLLDAGKGDSDRKLSQLAPELDDRLKAWQRDGRADDTPMEVGDDRLEVLPRFTRLLANSDTTLVFLDDTSLVSRRAESITLAAMGRFSASLAHEIRNPLAAISYATQLMEESNDITEADRRLLQIIHQQCLRTNGIVESVLSLARRERATPDHVDLVHLANHFIDDYRQTVPPENATLKLGASMAAMPALVDPKHLNQVLTALVNNAVRYGRLPGEAARVTLHLEVRDGRPTIDVLDRGPGIPEAVQAQLFRPFFTTSEHGTGLGLYIARELCRANEADLAYVSVPGGGGCFRITLPARNALLRTS